MSGGGTVMKYFVADAFTDELFHGNPAGIVISESYIPVETMQSIAFENNLSETAFLVNEGDYYSLRWFTPEVEVDLCGHATLASAFVIMNYIDTTASAVSFSTKSGMLGVKRLGDRYIMDFPSRKPDLCAIPKDLEDALGAKVLETHISRDLLVLVKDEKTVAELSPDMAKLKKITEPFAFIVTAAGNKYDFVSRFFAPSEGIDEDPVTGSAHSTLIPFWSERLNKQDLTAAQLSRRGGVLRCGSRGSRVEIGGKAVLYLRGELIL
jgi:PhzF family phenazine biosynthesis protein